jgi:hypothetical protein
MTEIGWLRSSPVKLMVCQMVADDARSASQTALADLIAEFNANLVCRLAQPHHYYVRKARNLTITRECVICIRKSLEPDAVRADYTRPRRGFGKMLELESNQVIAAQHNLHRTVKSIEPTAHLSHEVFRLGGARTFQGCQ